MFTKTRGKSILSVKLHIIHFCFAFFLSFLQENIRNDMISFFEKKSHGVFLWLKYAYDAMLLALTPFNNPLTIDTVCLATLVS